MTAVLFVCAGNTCRSPTGVAVLRQLLDEAGLGDAVQIDCAGIRMDRAGAPPTAKARQVAARQGVDLGDQYARPVRADDFAAFDYMLAMDRANFADLKARRPAGARARLDLLLAFAPDIGRDQVPDPHRGPIADYERVYHLIAAGAAGLLAVLQTGLG